MLNCEIRPLCKIESPSKNVEFYNNLLKLENTDSKDSLWKYNQWEWLDSQLGKIENNIDIMLKCFFSTIAIDSHQYRAALFF